MEFDLSIMGVALEDVVERSGELLALGADGLFTAEGPHDVTGALFLAAAGAPGASLMTNAAIAFPRNPIHLAHAAFDLQRLTGGRFRLGIAPQIRAHITRRFGIEWSSMHCTPSSLPGKTECHSTTAVRTTPTRS